MLSYRARYPPYSDRKSSLLSFLLRKRRPLPNLYLSHIFAAGLGIGLTFLMNYYLQVRKVYCAAEAFVCANINQCDYFTCISYVFHRANYTKSQSYVHHTRIFA